MKKTAAIRDDHSGTPITDIVVETVGAIAATDKHYVILDGFSDVD